VKVDDRPMHDDRRDRQTPVAGRLRVCLVAPPLLPVPPPRYGGTERVIHALATGLHARGHAVTVMASGDSVVPCELVATVPRACWTGGSPDLDASFGRVMEAVWREHRRFDVIHSHLDARGFALARDCPVPIVSTMHGRLDDPATAAALACYPDVPLIAISQSQRDQAPHANWVGVVHHGLDLAAIPFGSGGEELLFVGRIAEEKGIVDAIEVAGAAGRRLVIAAKVFHDTEADLFETAVAPAVRTGDVEYVGEVEPAARDAYFGRALATLMLGDWPEPFGLVAIESLAAGTPVIARRRGALPEIVEDAVDGFLVDDPGEAVVAVARAGSLDRASIRRRALARFSIDRMVDGYLRIYERLSSHGGARSTTADDHARARAAATT
jgi:glycosyltransferase involved in cell wall biosynthesis